MFLDLVHCSRVELSSICGISVSGNSSDVLEGSGAMTFKGSSGCRLVGLRWGEKNTIDIQTEGTKEKMPTLRQDACLQRTLTPKPVISLLIQGLLFTFSEKTPYQTYVIIYPAEDRDIVHGV